MTTKQALNHRPSKKGAQRRAALKLLRCSECLSSMPLLLLVERLSAAVRYGTQVALTSYYKDRTHIVLGRYCCSIYEKPLPPHSAENVEIAFLFHRQRDRCAQLN